MCDLIHSDTGAACGSRCFPRVVAADLWLQELFPWRPSGAFG
jgi:hypothetical protein